MIEDELATAALFIDELIELGVVGTHDGDILNNCPIFVVPKPGQPGQWQCIDYGKHGMINNVCISDPVFMSLPDDILPYLYPGGFMAAVDASKYFHMFPTKEGKRKHLGIIHPLLNKTLCYLCLPMGTHNIPSASGCFGASFICFLTKENEDFKGEPPKPNDFSSKWMNDETFDPKFGVGQVEISLDKLPKILV
jgi:hypothetical protein